MTQRAARVCCAEACACDEPARARTNLCLQPLLDRAALTYGALRDGAAAFGPLRRGSRAESRPTRASVVPLGLARHNPSLQPTFAGKPAPAAELQR